MSFHWCSPRLAPSLAIGSSTALARQWATPTIASRFPILLRTNTCLAPTPPKRASASGTYPISSSRPPDQCCLLCFRPTIHLLPKNLNQPSTPLPSPSHPQRRKTNGIETTNASLRRVSSLFFSFHFCALVYCAIACVAAAASAIFTSGVAAAAVVDVVAAVAASSPSTNTLTPTARAN